MSYHFATTSKTKSYCDAVKATEPIEPPALGFARPGDYTGLLATAAIIRQNNTQIQLLAQIAEGIQAQNLELQEIKQRLQEITRTNQVPDSLITKLQNLSLGTKPKEGKGQLRVFKDPYKILQEEKDKLRARQNEQYAHYNYFSSSSGTAGTSIRGPSQGIQTRPTAPP